MTWKQLTQRDCRDILMIDKPGDLEIMRKPVTWKGATDVDVAPVPARLIKNMMMMMMMIIAICFSK